MERRPRLKEVSLRIFFKIIHFLVCIYFLNIILVSLVE